MNFYIKSDGNGGINIGKGLAAICTVVLIFLGMFASGVMAVSTNSNKLDSLQDQVIDLKDTYDEAGPRHIETIELINDKISTNDKHIAVISEKINNIDINIKEIKQLLKK